jgi:hypothetical protein
VVGNYETEVPQQFCLNNNRNELDEIKSQKYETLCKEIKNTAVSTKKTVMVYSYTDGFKKNKDQSKAWKCRGLKGLKCYSDDKVNGMFTAEEKAMRWTCKSTPDNLCENCMKVGKYL